MTYSTGNTIVATDYNGFVSNNSSNVNSWWSTGTGSAGWGQTALAQVAAADTVYASSWANIVNSIAKAASHTGTSITSRTAPVVGDIIEIMPNLNTDIAAVYTNRGNAVSVGATNAAWTGTAAVTAATGTGNQNWTMTWTSTVTFPSADQARYFFNAGGLVQIKMSKTSTGKTKDSFWNSLVSSVGTIYISGGINGTQTIASTSYTGTTVVGGTGSPTVATSAGWYYLLTNGSTQIYKKNQTTSPYIDDYVSVTAQVSGAVLTLTTVWYSPGLLGQIDNSVSGGTATASPFSSFGTAPAVVVSTIYPEQTYLTNSWGTNSIAESVAVVTSAGPAPLYTTLTAATNFYSSTIVISGVGSGGRGPSLVPGYLVYGSPEYVYYGRFLRFYYASSVAGKSGYGTQFTSPRDMVFVNPAETLPTATMASVYGITVSDVRSLSSSVTVNFVTNPDDYAGIGYVDVTIGATPSFSDMTSASWVAGSQVGYPAYDRQYNLATSFTLPVPPVGHIYILSGWDNLGQDTMRITIPN